MTVQVPKASGRVFVSYASQDAAVAQRVCAALEAAGLPCWIAPRDVRAGESYAAAIVQAINSCWMLILVLSKGAIESSHVLREVERASSKKRPVLSIRMDTTPLPPDLEYFLSANQWLDASGGPVEQILPALVESVRDHESAPGVSTTAARFGSPLAPSPTPSKPLFRWRTRAMAIALAVAAVGLAYLLTHKLWLSKHVASEQTKTAAKNVVADKSVAVLPFVDLSEQHDQEYFADGMAEEVLDLLANIPGLTVIGRTSSFQFKGKNDDLRTIGTKLNVANVLEGSVRKAGDHVRVTAQLIDTHTGAHEWSKTFDRSLGDVLKLQDEIAAGLARALEVNIGADDLQPRGTIKNTEAYQFYLRGRHAFDRYDKDGDDEAAADFQKALDLEPTFANAAGYLAMTRAQQASDSFVNYVSGYEDARRWAETALRLDPSSAIGHSVLADYYTRFAWDWKAADREAKRAMELDSRGVIPLDASANLATTLGHWDEAVRLLNTALEIDPLNAALYWDLGNARYRSGRFPEAESAFRRLLQISPTFVSAHFELGRVLLERGQIRDALSEMEQESPEPESGRTAGLAMVYYALGRRADADAALKRLEAESAGDWPFGIAEIYAFRGEADKAFQWLDRAYIQKDELELIKGDPTFRKVDHDPRYNAFLRKMNLLE
jgi:TolB-like protein/Tfp pilus assembly protein PilF